MAKRFCAGCGQPIAQGFRICPNCGRVPEPEKPDFRVNTAQGKRSAPRNAGAAKRPPQSGRTAGQGQSDRYTYAPPRRPGEPQGERQRRPEGAYPERRQGGYQQPRRTGGYSGGERQPSRGDIYSERQRRAESYSRSSYGYGQPKLPAKNMPKKKPQPQRPAPKGSSKSKLSKFLHTSSKVVRIAVNTIKIAVLLAVIYGCIYLIEVYRVKLTPYPYQTPGRLAHNNFGQAITGYFSTGHWVVNPFTAKCTYKGKNIHNEEMELVFSAALNIKLSEITIDGQPLDKRYFESKVMGMFI